MCGVKALHFYNEIQPMNILIHSLLAKHWCIDTQFANSHIGLAKSILKGESVNVPAQYMNHSYHIMPASSFRADDECGDDMETSEATNESAGSIAIISIKGVMMKNDMECGPKGTATIAGWIKRADANVNVTGIILKVDSPGGAVDGTEELAKVIAECKKPIVGFVDGCAASAAYWAISQCDEVIASGLTSTVGSIGTMCKLVNIQPALEAEGVQFVELYATNSADKNKDYRDALAGDSTGLVSILDSLNAVFTSSVESGRSGKLSAKENVLTGKTYQSADAKKYGLVDSIGRMQDAFNAVIKLSKKQQKSMNNTQQYNSLQATLGWANGFEATEAGVHIQQADLVALETALSNGATAQTALATAQETIAAHEATIAGLQAQVSEAATATEALATATASLETATADLATANATVTAHEKTIADLQAQVAALGEQPANGGVETPADASAEVIPSTASRSKYVPDGSEAIKAKYQGVNK